MVDVGGAVQIVVAEPFDHGVRQQNAGLGLAVRGMPHRKIGGGIDQHLAGEFWAVAVARGQRHHGGEIAAGAVAADQQVPGVDAELASVVGNPLRRGDGVIGGGGEFVLRREAVIDGDHDQLALMGQLLADHFMGIEIADHPAAAVKEHQARRKAVILAQRLRGVDARRDRAVRRGDRQRLVQFERGRLGVHDGAGVPVVLARFRCGQRFIGGTAGVLKKLVDGGGIGIERDGHETSRFGLSFRGRSEL